MNRARAAVATHQTQALLVRKVAHGEADSVVTFFTEALGRVSALARNAERSRRRFGGSLEAMHTLHVRFEERGSAELLNLVEASIAVVRPRLLADLDSLETAGRALSWVRRAAPPRQREPGVWAVLVGLLDALDAPHSSESAGLKLGASGLQLLARLGWGIDLERCVRCGRECAQGRAAALDPGRGGLICRACGGARLKLGGAQRERLLRASREEQDQLLPEDVHVSIDIVEQALRAHAGLDP